jgi:hypothetical protein
MSVSKKQLIANCSNALESLRPKTGRGKAASSNMATLPIRRLTKNNIFKNEETNPFCRPSLACPIHSPATNNWKVIMFFGGTRI